MTFTPLPGGIDFSAQVAESLQPLTSIAVSIPAGNPDQSADITSVIIPNIQALYCIWQSTVPGDQILLTVQIVGHVVAQPQTLVSDGHGVVVPMPGSIVTSVPGAVCTVDIAVTSLAAGRTGTLFVFGMMSNALSIPTVRSQYLGLPGGSGEITVASGATTAILATPPNGTYYRVRFLSARVPAAPAAASRLAWILGASPTFLMHETTVAAGQSFAVSGDFGPVFGPISFANATSVSVVACVGYELWPA